MPLMMMLLIGLCLAVLMVELQSRATDAKIVALLGVLVAMNAALRFLDIVIPLPGGFSPIFVLIILGGYVFGGRFGFLMGALTLLVSALVTGGVGPWLPSQMFTAGWVGLSSTFLRPVARGVDLAIKKRRPGKRSIEVGFLAIFGAGWGLLYGGLMNLWSWPFITGPANQYWAPGISLGDTLQRYLAYYLVTSLAWDVMAALGNLILLSVFGGAALKALQRFRQRLLFEYHRNDFAPITIPIEPGN
jgi:energy-coupling factor transport system substrate-specific component